jgi:hypothetical protein
VLSQPLVRLTLVSVDTFCQVFLQQQEKACPARFRLSRVGLAVGLELAAVMLEGAEAGQRTRAEAPFPAAKEPAGAAPVQYHRESFRLNRGVLG